MRRRSPLWMVGGCCQHSLPGLRALGASGPWHVCALVCDARGLLLCWEPAGQRQALYGSAACEVSRILLRSCGP